MLMQGRVASRKIHFLKVLLPSQPFPNTFSFDYTRSLVDELPKIATDAEIRRLSRQSRYNYQGKPSQFALVGTVRY